MNDRSRDTPTFVTLDGGNLVMRGGSSGPLAAPELGDDVTKLWKPLATVGLRRETRE